MEQKKNPIPSNMERKKTTSKEGIDIKNVAKTTTKTKRNQTDILENNIEHENSVMDNFDRKISYSSKMEPRVSSKRAELASPKKAEEASIHNEILAKDAMKSKCNDLVGSAVNLKPSFTKEL